MNKNAVMFIVLGVIVGFVAGFMLANKLNGDEIAALRSGSAAVQTNSNSTASRDEESLSNDEIRAKIAEADANPTNLTFQKNLGISLYRYGAMKQDAQIIEESRRLLERARTIAPADFDVLVALGNAWFDLGFYKRDLASFTTARDIYGKALGVKPGDADVRTDIGISYFVQEPPDLDRSISELQAVVAANPKHDRAMQFLVQAYAKKGKVTEAEAMLAKIVEVNPSNTSLSDLRQTIADAKAGK